MKLASQEEVLQLLSLRTTTQSTAAVDVALETATSIAESILGTNMTRKSRRDRWNVDSEVNARLRGGGGFQFFLEDGFLPEPRIKLWASSYSIPTNSNSIVVPRDFYLVKAEEGVVYLTGTLLTSNTDETSELNSGGGLCTMMASYECGFAEDSEGVAQNVPDWLKQAALSACVQTLRSHTITFNKKGDEDEQAIHNMLTRTMRHILYDKVRPRYAGVFPFHTEIV